MAEHFLGIDHVTEPNACPWCGALHDRASGLDTNDQPSPGDWSICIHCAQPIIFLEGGSRRKATAEDFKTLAPEERAQIELAMATVRQIDRRKEVIDARDRVL